MESIIAFVANASLVVMLGLLFVAAAFILHTERTATERVLGVEMVAALLIGIVILLAVVQKTDTTLDVGIVLGALGFVGTMSIARYISEGRLF